jgi:hypothetical protein
LGPEGPGQPGEQAQGAGLGPGGRGQGQGPH